MDDLWTMPLNRPISADIIDAFLESRVREHEHLDYRARIDPAGDAPGARNRLVETVAAMANTGGTGLILVGVSEDGKTDRPEKGWLLTPGELRDQTIEAKCRELEPYVPLEIGRATTDEGEIVIVRVPDLQDRPVFLRDQGILIRRGQSNVPATPTEILSWIREAGPATAQVANPGFGYYFMDMTDKSSPKLNLGISPGRRWLQSRWGDDTDEALRTAAKRLYPDAGDLRVGDGVVVLSRPSAEDEGRVFMIYEGGEIVRTSRPQETSLSGPFDIVAVGVEVGRIWAFAQQILPEILPHFPGPATLHLSIGGVGKGFGFSRSRSTLWVPDVDRAPIRDRDNWRRQWPEVALGTDAAEVATRTVSEMLRAFGYQRVSPWLTLVRKACEGMSPRQEDANP
jgi:hypothetical protein